MYGITATEPQTTHPRPVRYVIQHVREAKDEETYRGGMDGYVSPCDAVLNVGPLWGIDVGGLVRLPLHTQLGEVVTSESDEDGECERGTLTLWDIIAAHLADLHRRPGDGDTINSSPTKLMSMEELRPVLGEMLVFQELAAAGIGWCESSNEDLGMLRKVLRRRLEDSEEQASLKEAESERSSESCYTSPKIRSELEEGPERTVSKLRRPLCTLGWVPGGLGTTTWERERKQQKATWRLVAITSIKITPY
ncbi:hypothetical protein DFH07DRAFT_767117 [Mycena maculata]|uniref:Uncharacterized protein n=1 Tax=Mycena maculata TaxID=230809 RepID=A0AAD7K2S2_9AGAR|nr:hypothetical protein DFH07DRAFT_767117 [Mycena maculata]